MSQFTLIMGNKNYSSWSMRPWLVLKHLAISFDEVVIPLYREESRNALLRYSPSGKVPVLKHGEYTVWDSLAICEYLSEIFSDRQLWPADPHARAHACSISAEMHSGFQSLRQNMPMNCSLSRPDMEGRRRLTGTSNASLPFGWSVESNLAQRVIFSLGHSALPTPCMPRWCPGL